MLQYVIGVLYVSGRTAEEHLRGPFRLSSGSLKVEPHLSSSGSFLDISLHWSLTPRLITVFQTFL